MAILVLLTSVLSACQPGEAATPTDLPTTQPTATPDQSAFREAWLRSPHADNYDLEKGPNTYCARCHSPANWDLTAKIDDPPNCVSCKFPFEAEPRQAVDNPLVAEEDWVSIDCGVCHRVENGFVDPELAWYDKATTYYETIPNATALCTKCHLDDDVLKHNRDLGSAAHADFQCTECHDAHSVAANCEKCHPVRSDREPKFIAEHQDVNTNEGCQECHAGIFESHGMEIQQAGNDDCMGCHGTIMGLGEIAPIQYGHSPLHQNVTCVACHDASGYDVAPVEGQDVWITFRTTELLGQTTTAPYQSHALQRTVSCERCHYSGNPWGLDDEPRESYKASHEQ